MDRHVRLAELLRRGSRILIFTGAGISTDSGIPDFRGPQGLWRRERPVYYDEFMASEEARVEYWRQKLDGWAQFRAARPNAVHVAVVDLERAGKVLAVVTQNIDGLHRRAGTSPERLVEIHGTMDAVECQTCGGRSDPEPWFERFRATRAAPRCPCGGFVKPATISFGQQLRSEDLGRAFDASRDTDLVIALGSTLSVQPAAQVPFEAAARGVPYAIVNQGPTEHDGLSLVTLRLEGDVTELFPAAVAEALGTSSRA
jgi:NAD-dependent deacetylase